MVGTSVRKKRANPKLGTGEKTIGCCPGVPRIDNSGDHGVDSGELHDEQTLFGAISGRSSGLETEEEPQTGLVSESSLVAEIRAAHANCEQALTVARSAESSALEHAKRCGELLLKAKKANGRGGWEAWRTENTGIPSSTASLYQRVYQHWGNLREAGIDGLRAADRYFREAKKISAAPQPLAQEEFEQWRDRYEAIGLRLERTIIKARPYAVGGTDYQQFFQSWKEVVENFDYIAERWAKHQESKKQQSCHECVHQRVNGDSWRCNKLDDPEFSRSRDQDMAKSLSCDFYERMLYGRLAPEFKSPTVADLPSDSPGGYQVGDRLNHHGEEFEVVAASAEEITLNHEENGVATSTRVPLTEQRSPAPVSDESELPILVERLHKRYGLIEVAITVLELANKDQLDTLSDWIYERYQESCE